MPEAPAAQGLGGTLGDAVRSAQRSLAAAGVEDAGRDARLLAAAAAGSTPPTLQRAARARVVGRRAGLSTSMVARRCAREPVARILGVSDSMGARCLSPATLDPRPIPKR